MKTYDLYGIRVDDLETARAVVEDALRIKLNPHESSYHCGDYYRVGDAGAEHIVLQRNHDDLEKEWTEEGFKEFPVLLYVNETDRAADIENALARMPAVSLLRRESL